MPRKIKLSSKQIEILDMVADGWSNLEIAVHFMVVKETIDFHISRARSAIGLKYTTRQDLLDWLSKNGWDVKCQHNRKPFAA